MLSSQTRIFNRTAERLISEISYRDMARVRPPLSLMRDIEGLSFQEGLFLLPLESPKEQVASVKRIYEDAGDQEASLNKRHMTDYSRVDVLDYKYYISLYYRVCDMALLVMRKSHIPRMIVHYLTDTHDDRSEYPCQLMLVQVSESGEAHKIATRNYESDVEVIITTRLNIERSAGSAFGQASSFIN